MSSNPMDQEIARLMAEGQAAARRGDRAMARTLLSQLVEQDPHNEEAWMWLSGVVSDASEQQICLENALVINPYNKQARRGLDFLLAKTGAPSRVPPAPPDASAPTLPGMEPEPQTIFGPGGPQHTENDPSAPVVPVMPESWAVPGPEPADPFLATAPYPASVDPAAAAGNGHSYSTGEAGQLAATVPYTAPEPAAGDMTYAPAMDGEPAAAAPGGNGTYVANDAAQAAGGESATDDPGMDTPPFVPPGFEPHNGKLAHEDTATDLPAWLENLTPSASASESHDTQYTPYGSPPEFGAAPGNGNAPGAGSQADPNMPFGAPAAMGAAAAMPQMSPFSELRLPSPHELPGEDGRSAAAQAQAQAQAQTQAQPWYLQGSSSSTMAPPMPTGGISNYLDSTMLNSSMLGGSAVGAAVLDERHPKSGASVECPNCKEHVPDTSLACPNCQYNFFVNCPHCHELVDTAGSMPGQLEPCPYCKAPINRMELGMGGVQDLVSQKNPGSRPAAAAAMTVAFPSMQQDIPGLKGPRRGLRFDWVVDLLWLVAVVLMVWALTQLPTWLNLPGMY